MPPKVTPTKDNRSATIGIEATALRGSSFPPREAILRSLSAAKDNLWLTSDSRGEAKLGDNSIYGQDKWARRQQPKQSNATTRRLAVVNLALRGIEADFGPEHADTFRRDLHPGPSFFSMRI